MRRAIAIAIVIVAAGVILAGGWAWLGRDTGGAPIVAVTVPELSAHEAAGAALYETHCAACHGPDAAGRAGTAPSLVHEIYEPGHHPDAAFVAAVELGVHAHHWDYGDMPAVQGLDRDAIAAITAYVRALQRANDIH